MSFQCVYFEKIRGLLKDKTRSEYRIHCNKYLFSIVDYKLIILEYIVKKIMKCLGPGTFTSFTLCQYFVSQKNSLTITVDRLIHRQNYATIIIK